MNKTTKDTVADKLFKVAEDSFYQLQVQGYDLNYEKDFNGYSLGYLMGVFSGIHNATKGVDKRRFKCEIPTQETTK